MKKDLQVKLEEQLREKLLLLPEFIYDFIEILKYSKKELRTRFEYTKDIIVFFEFLIKSKKYLKDNIIDITVEDLEKLTARDINDYLDYLTKHSTTYYTKTGKKVTQTFTNTDIGKSRKLATLHKLFAHLYKNKTLSKDITQGIDFKATSKAKIKNRLDSEEIDIFFNTILEDVQIENDRKIKFHQKVKFRDYAIVLILAYTGIRVSELVQLDLDDISIDKKALIVNRKGGNEQRIPIPNKVIEDLSDYIRQRKELTDVDKSSKNALFISLHKKRINPRTVRVMLEKYRQRSGIEIKITPHVFRRTFGTKHYNTYKDMYLTAQVLGHSSAETTRKFYADPSEERVIQSMEIFDYEKPENNENEVSLSIDKISLIAEQLGINVNTLLKRIK